MDGWTNKLILGQFGGTVFVFPQITLVKKWEYTHKVIKTISERPSTSTVVHNKFFIKDLILNVAKLNQTGILLLQNILNNDKHVLSFAHF